MVTGKYLGSDTRGKKRPATCVAGPDQTDPNLRRLRVLQAEGEVAAARVGIDVPLVVTAGAVVADGLVRTGGRGGSHHAPAGGGPLVQVQVEVRTRGPEQLA